MNKHLSTILTIAFFAVSLISCEQTLQDFVVSFDSNGGSNIIAQIVTKGGKATEPFTAPTKSGNEFIGWFSYDNVFDKWDFATQAIITDIILYAKWTAIAIEDSNGMKTISLMERDDYAIFEKTVILHEDENYLIKAPLFYFLGSVNDFLVQTGTKGGSVISPFIEQIIFDGKKNNVLYSSSYFQDKFMLDRVLSIFLESGQCHVYDKNSHNSIRQVKMEDYWTDSYGGRRFYFIDNIKFIETLDYYSIGPLH